MARAAALPALLVLTAALSGCGPVPVAQAERECVEDARMATGPRSTVQLGIGAEGGKVRPYGGVEVAVSSDYITGRDPAEVFNRCVARRSGQMPTRPLYDQPGWRG